VLLAQALQHFHGFGDDFRADAVTGENQNFGRHLVLLSATTFKLFENSRFTLGIGDPGLPVLIRTSSRSIPAWCAASQGRSDHEE